MVKKLVLVGCVKAGGGFNDVIVHLSLNVKMKYRLVRIHLEGHSSTAGLSEHTRAGGGIEATVDNRPRSLNGRRERGSRGQSP